MWGPGPGSDGQAGVRRDAASESFPFVRGLAEDHGLKLVCHGDAHYQLEPDTEERGWLVNIYPGNQRLYHDRNRPKAPFLDAGRPWTLESVVRAAIAAMGDE